MSETPETDEASFDYDARAEYWVDAEFARKLERERDALKKALLSLVLDFPRPTCGDFHHAKKDRHALHEECPVLRRFNDRMEKLRKLAQ
jgi:hypothetical protein